MSLPARNHHPRPRLRHGESPHAPSPPRLSADKPVPCRTPRSLLVALPSKTHLIAKERVLLAPNVGKQGSSTLFFRKFKKKKMEPSPTVCRATGKPKALAANGTPKGSKGRMPPGGVVAAPNRECLPSGGGVMLGPYFLPIVFLHIFLGFCNTGSLLVGFVTRIQFGTWRRECR